MLGYLQTILNRNGGQKAGYDFSSMYKYSKGLFKKALNPSKYSHFPTTYFWLQFYPVPSIHVVQTGVNYFSRTFTQMAPLGTSHFWGPKYKKPTFCNVPNWQYFEDPTR